MTPEQIAAGLSKAHKAAILRNPNDDMPAQVALDFIGWRIIKPISVEPSLLDWTELGLAVRKILQEQNDAG